MNNFTPRIRVGLIIDEFFGGAGTAFGGYGFLARNLIAKYLHNENIEIDILLGKGKKNFSAECYCVDNVKLYKLPRRKWFATHWGFVAQRFEMQSAPN